MRFPGKFNVQACRDFLGLVRSLYAAELGGEKDEQRLRHLKIAGNHLTAALSCSTSEKWSMGEQACWPHVAEALAELGSISDAALAIKAAAERASKPLPYPDEPPRHGLKKPKWNRG